MSVPVNAGGVCFDFCGVKLMLSNTDRGVWRLQSKKDGSFDSSGAAQTLAKDLGENVPEFICETGFSKTEGGLRVFAKDGTFVEIGEKSVGFYAADGVLKRCITGITEKPDSISISQRLFDGECIYGTGERFNAVNQRGKKIHIYAIDKWCRTEGNSYMPIPFVISTNISGVFFNRYEHSVFDIGKTASGVFTVEQKYAPIDMYVFIAESPAEILYSYSRITGFAPMPADWAFGTLVCRYHPEFSTKEGIFAMADAMEKNRFPWDAVITEGWGTYDNSRWNELKEVSDFVHSLGKKMMVYEQCGKFPGYADDKLGLTDKHAVQSENGTLLRQTRSLNLLDNFHRKKMRCVDLTSDECKKKWREIWDELVFNVGVDGAKIDFCEQFPDKPTVKFSDGRNPMAAHHWFPTYYNILSYKHFCERPDGGIAFARGGGIGAQRHPFVWAGDQRREFFFLRVVLKAVLSSGFSGVPFVSWDMAGYRPAYNPFDKLHEDRVFIRGIEFTAFSANIQTHGSVKRPYDFDEHTKDVYRAYANIHEKLRPYIKEQAAVSCKTGMPLLRHLFLYDCKDENTYGAEDEYMLGCGLLVAPVLTNKTHRNVYLPKGKWVNIFSGEEFDGGKMLENFNAPLETIPVFSLCGAESEKLSACLEDIKASGILTELLKTE